MDGFVPELPASTDTLPVEAQLKTITGNEFPRGHVDGIISEARLWGPISMTKLNGDYYFTDFYTVRKISMSTPSNPTVETIAGTPGVPGKQDGVGIEARFNTMTGIATDGTYLYVSDASNHAIRRIHPLTKQVEVFAGILGTPGDVDGTGTAARLSSPRGIIYLNNELYFVDAAGLVKKATLDGTVSVVAGTRGALGHVNSTLLTSRFSNMYSLTTDGTNLYAVEAGNRTVRKIDLAGNAVTTLAGNYSNINLPGNNDGDSGNNSLESPMGIEWVNGNLWIAEQNSHVVRKLDLTNPANPVLSTILGKTMEGQLQDGIGTNARLLTPRSLFYDISSNVVFVMSRHGSTISRVNPSSLQVQHWIKPPAPTVTALSGNGGSIVYPRGLIKDGNKIVFTTRTHEIRILDLDTNSVSTLAGARNVYGSSDGQGTAGKFSMPSGIIKYGDGYIVADFFNFSLRYVKPDGTVATLVGLSGTSGTADQAALGNTARFTNPRELVLSGSVLYVTDSNRIRQVTLPSTDKILVDSPEVKTLVGGSVAGTVCPGHSLNSPSGVVLRTENSEPVMYISENTGHRIRRLNLVSCALTNVAGSGTAGNTNGTGTAPNAFNSPGQMVEFDGGLYVASSNSHTIKRVDLTTFEITSVFGGSTDANQDGYGTYARIEGPYYMTLDGTYLYVTQPNYHHIRRINLQTRLVERISQNLVWGGMEYGVPQSSIDGTLNYHVPYFFNTVKIANNYYSSDIINNVIWKTRPDGQREVFAGKIGVPGSTDGYRLDILLTNPQGLEFDQNYLYIAELSAHTIRRISLTTGLSSTIIGTAGQAGVTNGIGTAARLTRPSSLRIHNGYLYISSHDSGLIYRSDLQTLNTELFAGTPGVRGGANGPRLSSTFSIAYGMIASGNTLYVGDGGNYTIRAIDLSESDSGVTTYLGVSGTSGNKMGDGSSATFTYPISMVMDGLNMILVDRQNHLLKTFNPVLNWVSSFVGSSDKVGLIDGTLDRARLTHPCSISKSDTELVISDGQCWNLRIYK